MQIKYYFFRIVKRAMERLKCEINSSHQNDDNVKRSTSEGEREAAQLLRVFIDVMRRDNISFVSNDDLQCTSVDVRALTSVAQNIYCVFFCHFCFRFRRNRRGGDDGNYRALSLHKSHFERLHIFPCSPFLWEISFCQIRFVYSQQLGRLSIGKSDNEEKI